MTYNVFSGTLNPTQSTYNSTEFDFLLLTRYFCLCRQKPYLTLWLKLLANFALMLMTYCLSPIRYHFLFTVCSQQYLAAWYT